MPDFVDDFLDSFDGVVYKTLSHLERDFVGRPGWTAYDISNTLDQSIRLRIGSAAIGGLVDNALRRLERDKRVVTLTSDHGSVWRTIQILDTLALLPRPHHAD